VGGEYERRRVEGNISPVVRGITHEPGGANPVYPFIMRIKWPSGCLHRLLAGAAAAGALALTSGCIVAALGAAGAAGAGTVAYVEGKLTATLANPYERVVRASNLAIHQMQFLELGETKDALSDEIKARTAEDKKITILITRVSDALTRVEIRVGLLGDRPVSQTILDRINANL